MTPTRTTVSGDGTPEDRLRSVEIVLSKHVQHLDDQEKDIVEIKGDVKDIRSGQRALIIAMFTLAVSFMGVSAALLAVAH